MCHAIPAAAAFGELAVVNIPSRRIPQPNIGGVVWRAISQKHAAIAWGSLDRLQFHTASRWLERKRATRLGATLTTATIICRRANYQALDRRLPVLILIIRHRYAVGLQSERPWTQIT